MKKIHKIKEWFSLSEASDRLTGTLGEPVNVSDLIELAIEGHINLYWYMRHQPAVEVEYGTNRIRPLSSPDKETLVEGLFPVNSDGLITYLEGPFIVVLQKGDALADFLRFGLNVFDDPANELVAIGGYYVKDQAGKIWNLQERFENRHLLKLDTDSEDPIRKFGEYNLARNFFPSSKKPSAEQLGFTRNELEDFEKAMNAYPVREITSREKQTLLKMIIGMAKDGYGFDPDALRSPFPKELEGILDQLGISVSDDTVRKWLKEAAELLPQELKN